MAHILFLSWWWPYPADNGSKQRIYNLLRHLAREHRVTLLSFAEAEDAAPERIEHLRGFCAHVEALPKPTYNPGALKALLGYFSRWPRSLVDVYSPAMAERAAAAAGGSPPVDVVIASEIQTMRYLSVLPHLPAVLETPEVTSFYDNVNRAAGWSGRLRAWLTLGKLQNALRRWMQRGAVLTVVSETERDYIRAFAPAGARIEVIPNGIDTEVNRPNPMIEPEPYTLIYTGAVTYHANYDAVDYFIREVWPLIRARTPKARFVITGGTGKVNVSHLAGQPGVTFAGYLPEIAPAVQKSWLVVVPLRVGSGTRLKILEAMALGVPVVSTRKGAEGLNVHPGEDILIADTPAQMVETICQLFEDGERRARLAEAGRALVEREYDWGVITHHLLNVIESVGPSGRG